MSELPITPEDLLAGAAVTYAVALPAEIVWPGKSDMDKEPVVTLKPLTIGTFQLIMKASRQDVSLIPLLMIKESLVQPSLTIEQVKSLPLGLVNYLIGRIRDISGLVEKKSP